MSEIASEIQESHATADTPVGDESFKPEPANVTFSAIGDVSVAASEAMGQLAELPKQTVWKSIVLFFCAVYAASVAYAWLLPGSSRWFSILVVPLFPVVCASAAFWRRQRWKFRAKEWKVKLKIWQDALESLGFESANAVNAIRANLIGFRLANPEASMPEHLDEIQLGTHRIAAALERAQDPVAWKGQKKKAVKAATGIGVEDTRARINL